MHPGFFSTGAALYTTAEIGLMMGAAGGWKGLGGVPICVIKGYYGTGPLVEQYKISPVEVPDFVAAADAVISGKCTALAYDSGESLHAEQWPQLEQIRQMAAPAACAACGWLPSRERSRACHCSTLCPSVLCCRPACCGKAGLAAGRGSSPRADHAM